ncbi:platelet-activating factor acetylhydrolase [Suillus paluster]|uniref:platelet-activating factor acetylhydrolase n=1 Tax=Suillus paluster TaxID=48578 RepID=UPI001B865338|nr:platelet-activating factor acetylhydrolase [Suillus paluster]KAG1741441.1 platelet-activating factor acetylhydrolase [Suillus paluster]
MSSSLEQSSSTPYVSSYSKRSPLGALFSRTLPSYSGQYPVGVHDVELSIPKQSFGNFKHISMPDAEAGLTIDTVMFTLFYPATSPHDTSRQAVWFPRLRQTIDGFLKMAKRTPNCIYRAIAYLTAAAAIWGTAFPAIENAPLMSPPPSVSKWPVIIFSHGVGCSRLMYSAFCGEMASRGYVVVAIEHRDGTGPSSRITAEGGIERDFYWLDWSDLQYAKHLQMSVLVLLTHTSWVDLEEQPKNDTTLRHVQLEVRKAELEHVIRAVYRISQSEQVPQTRFSRGAWDWTPWTCIDPSNPIMTGHSFGGSLALAAAASGSFHFSHVIVFDPATQRLTPWKGQISSPLLTINSEEFSLGAEFTVLQEVATTASSWHTFLLRTYKDILMSLILIFLKAGATHPAFSDVFLILPDCINRLVGLAADPLHIIGLTIDTVVKFLESGTEDAWEEVRRVDSRVVVSGGLRNLGELIKVQPTSS